MARIENTVFISYRRADVYTALAVYENLKKQDYDIFFDYRSISSGDFEQIIASNIRARAHFLLILTPTALDRCNEPDDWLRREIELAIDEKRNIVPLFFKGFRFGDPSVSEKLTGKLKNLSRYNGLNVHEDYFDEAMHRVRTQYLNIPLDTVLHPLSTEVAKVVREEQVAADKALEQIEDVKELVTQGEEKPSQKKEQPKPVATQTVKSVSTVPWRTVAGLGGGLLLIVLLIWGGLKLLQNSPVATLEPIQTSQRTAMPASQPTETNIPLSTKTSVPLMPTLGVGSSMISDRDGMTLLYIPAGEFTMGSDNGSSDERPVHQVTLVAFWVDQTEVTNEMYSRCMQDGNCNQPSNTIFYNDSDYANHPVAFVSWNDANAYCTWAGRRLPTEAEWEKAARGTDGRTYPWGYNFDGTLLNFCDKNCSFDWADKSSDDGFASSAPVGSYPKGASPYGVLDMAGNVWEWVADWYGEFYYSGSPTYDPLGPSSGELRVLRGGASSDVVDNVRSTYRERRVPAFTDSTLGFRCAVSEADQAGSNPSPQTAAEASLLTQTPELGIGSTMTGKDGMTLLYVPAGEFTMGSNNGDTNERPVHTVYLDTFWIDKTEVTNAMYAICVQDGKCKQPNDTTHYDDSNYANHPVVFVSWNDAKSYCSWADRRLPTEAEWEKAPRGESALVYPWGNSFDGTRLNFCDKNCTSDWADKSIDDGFADTAPVGNYLNGASPYGVLDMAGNVWEWVAD